MRLLPMLGLCWFVVSGHTQSFTSCVLEFRAADFKLERKQAFGAGDADVYQSYAARATNSIVLPAGVRFSLTGAQLNFEAGTWDVGSGPVVSWQTVDTVIGGIGAGAGNLLSTHEMSYTNGWSAVGSSKVEIRVALKLSKLPTWSIAQQLSDNGFPEIGRVKMVFQLDGLSTEPKPAPTVPSTAVVIPADAKGPVEVILESSADMINWVPALPGTYGASDTNRFFRVRSLLH